MTNEEVSGLVERLRKGIEYATCGYTDFPLTNEANATMREAADALASLSAQLADDRKHWERMIQIAEDRLFEINSLTDRAETAEAENERLRAAIIKAMDPSSAGIGGIESAEDGVAYMAGVLLPALGIGDIPSKEDKTDAE